MDTLAVELVIEDQKAIVKLDNFGQKIKLVNDNINQIGGDKSFAGKMTTDLDALAKKSEAVYQSFRNVANTKLDSGNIGHLTREILTAQTRAQALAADVVNIRKELANPNRSTSISFLITELKGAEKELESLTRKLNSVKTNSPGNSGSGNFGNSFGTSVLGADFGSAAFFGGVAGGATVAAISEVKSLISSVTAEIKDLSVEAVRLAANFEETTNSIAVFSSSTQSAKNELSSLDSIALKTNGLRLESAEEGYRRLRALGFAAKTAQDLVVGLGKQRLISGTTEQNVQRVVTHFEQIAANPELASRDFKFAVRDLPTLRNSFKEAFGTADYKELQKLVTDDPTKFFEKLAASMANSKQAAAGLNIGIEKLLDAGVQSGRVFGEPFLKPFTKDVQDLTVYLNRNEDTLRHWGQSAADAVQGVSDVLRALRQTDEDTGGLLSGAAVGGARGLLAGATFGLSEVGIAAYDSLEARGKRAREREDLRRRPEIFAQNLKDGVDFAGVRYTLDPVTNTLQRINETIEKTPSLDEQIKAEKADKAAKQLKQTLAQLAELPVKFALEGVSQNLELNKAIAVRNAKGDTFKLAKATQELEINSLREQISLSNKMAAVKTQNLSSEDFTAGKGQIIAQENAANVAKLNNQILLVQINSQRQQTEEIEKAKQKIKDLEKQYLSTFDTLQSRAYSDNPFVSIFSEGDKALRDLKDNLKGLPGELQTIALKMQQQFNLRKLLEIRADNKLSVFDLRESAENFRNPFDPEKNKLEEDQFIKRFLYDNPNYLFLKRKEYNQKNLVGGLKSFLPFEDEVRRDILSRGKFDTPADRLNKSLDEKFNLLYKPRQSAEETAIADRRFISATSGVNPLDLNRNLREQAAVAREREALRQERYQQDAIQLYREQKELQKQIAANTNRQNQIAEKGGTKALEITLKDETSGAKLEKSATRGDTENAYYDPDLSFSGSGGLTNR